MQMSLGSGSAVSVSGAHGTFHLVATCPAVPILGVFRHICKCVFVPVCRVGVGAKAAQGPCFSDWAWGRGRAACQPPLWGTVRVLGAPGCVAPALGSVWGPGLGHVLVGRPGGWDACPKCGPGLCQMESSRTSVLLAEGTDGKWCLVIGRDLLHTHTPCVCTHNTHKHIRVDTPWLQHWLPGWQELTLAQLCVAVQSCHCSLTTVPLALAVEAPLGPPSPCA